MRLASASFVDTVLVVTSEAVAWSAALSRVRALLPQLWVVLAVIGRVLVRWIAAPEHVVVQGIDYRASGMIMKPTILCVKIERNAGARVLILLVLPAHLAAVIPRVVLHWHVWQFATKYHDVPAHSNVALARRPGGSSGGERCQQCTRQSRARNAARRRAQGRGVVGGGFIRSIGLGWLHLLAAFSGPTRSGSSGWLG